MEEEDNTGGGRGTSGTARGTTTRKDGNNKEDREDNRGDNGDDIGDGDKDNSLRTIFPGAHPPRFLSALSSLLLPSFLVAVPLAVPDVPSPPVVVLLLHQSAPVLALFPLPRLKTASSRGDENLGGRAPGKIMLKEALYNP